MLQFYDQIQLLFSSFEKKKFQTINTQKKTMLASLLVCLNRNFSNFRWPYEWINELTNKQIILCDELTAQEWIGGKIELLLRWSGSNGTFEWWSFAHPPELSILFSWLFAEQVAVQNDSIELITFVAVSTDKQKPDEGKTHVHAGHFFKCERKGKTKHTTKLWLVNQ